MRRVDHYCSGWLRVIATTHHEHRYGADFYLFFNDKSRGLLFDVIPDSNFGMIDRYCMSLYEVRWR